MSEFMGAIDQVIARATQSGTLQDLQQALEGLEEVFVDASIEQRNEALQKLNAVLPSVHPVPAAKIANLCGALVETGGDPHICGVTLMPLLKDTLQKALKFHDACYIKADADGLIPDSDEEDEPDPDELADKYFQDMLEEEPELAWAFMGEREVSLALIAHMTTSKSLRAQACSQGLLEDSIAYDSAYAGGRSFLTKMLMILDDEPVLVLDAEQNKGYRITISAIPDNFTLHTYLMGKLIGNPGDGWISAAGIDHEALNHAMTHVCDENAPTLTGTFNLWNWTGLRADGRLPEPGTSSEQWIWNEGVPAEILPFEGTRVIVLGPPPYARSWRGGLVFHRLQPEFSVNESLSESEVAAWLKRLANAPRPTAES